MNDSSQAMQALVPSRAAARSNLLTLLDQAAAPWRTFRWPTWILAALVLAVIPFAAPALTGRTFLVQIAIGFFVFSGIAQCWNLVLGVSGIFSLAQLAFYAVGGYGAGLLAVHVGLSPWTAIWFGPLAAVVASLIVGLAVLRLRGVYVALLTLAFVELLRNFLQTGPQFFGGGFGLRFSTLFAGPGALTRTYFAGLVVFLITSVAVWLIMYSPIGMGFVALRDSEAYAVSRGINPLWLKLALFAYSSFFLGLLGAFSVFWQGLAAPSMLDFGQLIFVLMMIVAGGWGTFSGPIIGAGILIIVNEVWLKAIDAAYAGLALGVFLFIFVVAVPEGIAPAARRLVNAGKRWYAALEDE
jgi:branched-chain amino acid transport system permease protein